MDTIPGTSKPVMVPSPTVTKMSFLKATDQTVLEIIRAGEAPGSLYRVAALRASQYLRCGIWFRQAQCLQTWVTDYSFLHIVHNIIVTETQAN